MTLYASVARLKDALGVSDQRDDAKVQLAAETASEMVDDYCGRTFGTVVATRVFAPEDEDELEIGDLAGTAITVQSKSNVLGTSYDLTWSATEYLLQPLNGLRAGVTWPYTTIVALAPRFFLEYEDVPTVQVTGTWGWPSVPARVTMAATLQAERLFKRFDSPLGVAGFGDMGVMRVSRQLDPDVEQMLTRYRRGEDAVGGIA